jgi:CYTH domain-containing protein
MKKEIERKFLLRDLPIVTPDFSLSEIQNILQYYYFVDGIWKRIRKIESNIYGQQFLHTVKYYKDGIIYEEEYNASSSEYRSLVSDINSGKYETRFISKTRHIYFTGNDADFEGEIKNLKWEIDNFNFKLVVAEIEIPDFSYKIEIPDFIKDKLIYEVTNIPEFSNKNLAQKLIFQK